MTSSPSSVNSKTSARAKSQKSKRAAAKNKGVSEEPKHKKEFEKFHSENGVRTVMGSIGPVQNGVLHFILHLHPHSTLILYERR